MNDKLKCVFDGIHAEEQLKRDTLAFLQRKIRQGSKKNHLTGVRRLAVALACFMTLTFTGILSHNIYFTDTMYVDVDINPSIELTVNRFDRVIDTHAYNADGEELLLQIELMHKPYDHAVALLTEAAIEKGYLLDGGLVSVTLQSSGGASDESILQTLQTNISYAAQEHHSSIQIDAFSVDSGTREHAHAQNLSPAKYLAILELQAVDPTATVEGCRNHTIVEIRERTKEHGGGRHCEDDSDQVVAGDEENQNEGGGTLPVEAAPGNGHHGNGRRGNGHK